MKWYDRLQCVYSSIALNWIFGHGNGWSVDTKQLVSFLFFSKILHDSSQPACNVARDAATYFTSAEDWETACCFFETHENMPEPIVNAYSKVLFASSTLLITPITIIINFQLCFTTFVIHDTKMVPRIYLCPFFRYSKMCLARWVHESLK